MKAIAICMLKPTDSSNPRFELTNFGDRRKQLCGWAFVSGGLVFLRCQAKLFWHPIDPCHRVASISWRQMLGFTGEMEQRHHLERTKVEVHRALHSLSAAAVVSGWGHTHHSTAVNHATWVHQQGINAKQLVGFAQRGAERVGGKAHVLIDLPHNECLSLRPSTALPMEKISIYTHLFAD